MNTSTSLFTVATFLFALLLCAISVQAENENSHDNEPDSHDKFDENSLKKFFEEMQREGGDHMKDFDFTKFMNMMHHNHDDSDHSHEHGDDYSNHDDIGSTDWSEFSREEF